MADLTCRGYHLCTVSTVIYIDGDRFTAEEKVREVVGSMTSVFCYGEKILQSWASCVSFSIEEQRWLTEQIEFFVTLRKQWMQVLTDMGVVKLVELWENSAGEYPCGMVLVHVGDCEIRYAPIQQVYVRRHRSPL